MSVILGCLGAWSARASAAVTFQAAGTAVSGTVAVSPAWPAHAIGDIALLFVESTGGEAAALSTSAGFVEITGSPRFTGAGTTGTRLTVFWARATSTTMPTPTVADPGDHVYARILTYRGAVASGNPWNVTGGGVKATDTVTLSSVTTGVANTRIVQACSRESDSTAASFSAQTNASLSGITERADAGGTGGNGGGFAVWDGVLAAAGATGNTTATVLPSLNAFVTIALKPQGVAAPTFQAAGTASTGTGAVSPAWPAHAINDVALLFVESVGTEAVTLSTPAGFVAVPNTPQINLAGTTGTRLTVFWARATSTTMPTPTVADPGDHAYARIITYRGVVTAGNPWDVTGGGIRAEDVTLSSVTTTVPGTLVVQAVTREDDSAAVAFSAQTNASLTGITERSDAGTISGNGGGFAVWDGTLAAAGATGNTTATIAIGTTNAFLTLALVPDVTPPDHYELSLATSGVACIASTATVTACADSSSPCTNNYTAVSGTTATLATSAGSLGATTVTFDAAGVATTTLSYPAAADGATAIVTLSAEQTAATNSRKCCQGGVCVVANSCTTTFNTAGFIFSASAGGAVATIPAQSAGTTSSTYYLRAVKTSTTTQACEAALAGANTVNFAYECNNPTSCSASNLMSINGGTPTTIARNNNGSVSSYTAVSVTFDANGNAPLTFNYSDAGQATLYASKAAGGSLLTALSGSSNAFVTKPWGFVLAATCADATVNAADQTTPSTADPKFCRAGQNFNATATAVTQALSAAPNYGRESTAETVAAAWTRQLPASGANGTLPSGSLPFAGSGGVFGPAATPFVWDEVGILKAVLTVGDGNYLGAGNVSSTAYVGRFYPDHFDVTITPPPGSSAFVYAGRDGTPVTLGQAFTVEATAKNGLGSPTTTTNYNTTEGFSQNVDLTLTAGGTGTGKIYVDAVQGGSGAIPATKFAGGIGTVNYNDGTGKISYVFDAFPTAATAISLHADDAETVTSPMVAGSDGSTSARAGRLQLSNAFGSERLPLMVPAVVQYHDGTNWPTSILDSSSPPSPWAVVPAVPTALVGSGGNTTPSLGATLAAGLATLSASAPGVDQYGYLDLTVTVPDYLKFPWAGCAVPTACVAAEFLAPNSRVTFGIFKGNNRIIYRQERYY